MLSAASHGTDQLIVQRLLASRGLRDARFALVGSGVVVLAEFGLFLLIGVALAAAGRAPAELPNAANRHPTNVWPSSERSGVSRQSRRALTDRALQR